MGRLSKPTDAELAILRVLWQRGPSTVREVLDDVELLRPLLLGQARDREVLADGDEVGRVSTGTQADERARVLTEARVRSSHHSALCD